jgi:hypothetical protein
MWELTTKEPWVEISHHNRIEPILTFTDGYGKLHVAWDDKQLVLLRDDGEWITHWPLEVIKAVSQNVDNHPTEKTSFHFRKFY